MNQPPASPTTIDPTTTSADVQTPTTQVATPVIDLTNQETPRAATPMTALRRALAATNPTLKWPESVLVDAISAAKELHDQGEYHLLASSLSWSLPQAIAHANHPISSSQDTHANLVHDAYGLALNAVSWHGCQDLAALIADRLRSVENRCPDPLRPAITALWIAEHHRHHRTISNGMRQINHGLSRITDAAAPHTRAVATQMHLTAARLAAHGGDPSGTCHHLNQAARHLDAVTDAQPYTAVAASGTHLAIHRVAALATLGDIDAATEATTTVTITDDIPLLTRVDFGLATATIASLRHDTATAITTLLHTHTLAPHVVLAHPTAVELITALTDCPSPEPEVLALSHASSFSTQT